MKATLKYLYTPSRMTIIKDCQQQVLTRIGGKWNSHSLLVKMQNGPSLKISLAIFLNK